MPYQWTDQLHLPIHMPDPMGQRLLRTQKFTCANLSGHGHKKKKKSQQFAAFAVART